MNEILRGVAEYTAIAKLQIHCKWKLHKEEVAQAGFSGGWTSRFARLSARVVFATTTDFYDASFLGLFTILAAVFAAGFALAIASRMRAFVCFGIVGHNVFTLYLSCGHRRTGIQTGQVSWPNQGAARNTIVRCTSPNLITIGLSN
jgi:hypothetical protein